MLSRRPTSTLSSIAKARRSRRRLKVWWNSRTRTQGSEGPLRKRQAEGLVRRRSDTNHEADAEEGFREPVRWSYLPTVTATITHPQQCKGIRPSQSGQDTTLDRPRKTGVDSGEANYSQRTPVEPVHTSSTRRCQSLGRCAYSLTCSLRRLKTYGLL